MKVILNCSETNPFNRYNGLTFNVHSVQPFGVSLEIDNAIVSYFDFKDIIIVDVLDEIAKAFIGFENANKLPSNVADSNYNLITMLHNYCNTHNIKYK